MGFCAAAVACLPATPRRSSGRCRLDVVARAVVAVAAAADVVCSIVRVDEDKLLVACRRRRFSNGGFLHLRRKEIRLYSYRINATKGSSMVEPNSTISASPSLLATEAGWEQFAGHVSGEWDGFGAEFDPRDGQPIALPPSVVPEAFREWGVEVFDWQTQCPTLATSDSSQHLHYKLIHLLPTVGCEADAATPHTINEQHAVGDAVAFCYAPSGCYIAVWPVRVGALEVEHCIVHPADPKVRVRVVHVVTMRGEASAVLGRIQVFSEQWYGPFRNGEQLGGCAVRESGFAAGEKLNLADFHGLWQSNSALVAQLASKKEQDVLCELLPYKLENPVRDQVDIVPLPKQLWSRFKEIAEGEYLCEAGWLLDHDNAVTSRCVIFMDGRVKEMVVAYETRRVNQYK